MAALSLGGILDVAIIERSVDEKNFKRYIEGLLLEMNSYPDKNSVLVMDNVAYHYSEGLRPLVEEQ